MLQTFEDGSPLGDTRFMDFGAGINATLVGEDYVLVEGSGGGSKPYATYVIAASDSIAPGKENADYVCDGVSDQIEINAAINTTTTSTGRARILLLEGTYTLSDNVLVSNRPDITIEGQGSGTRLICSSSTYNDKAIEFNGSDRGRVANLAIDLSVSTVTTPTGVNLNGVYFFNSDDCACVGLDIRNVGYGITNFNLASGIRYQSSDRMLITGCYIEHCQVGIQAEGSESVISNNRIRDTKQGGIKTANFYYGLIVGNFLNNTGILDDSAVAAITMTPPSQQVSIIGNRILGSAGTPRTQGGIYLPDDEDSNTAVIGNYISDIDRMAIRVDGSDYQIVNNVIFRGGQKTNATYDGIILGLVSSADNCNIQANIVRHDGTTNKFRYGIRVNNSLCDTNLITNNDLKNSGTTGSLSDLGTGTVTAAGNRL